jgi:SAM-dependent methyltransferase
MPAIEQKALELAKGNILDLGCGAGSHALYLQNQGFDVKAIDISPGAIRVSKMRGVKKAYVSSHLNISEEKFDTVLILMNGTGIFQTLKKLPQHLQHLKSLLQPDGQILVDSSDLIYMFDRTEEGGVWVPGDKYYGEIEYSLTYRGETSEPFAWLYLDEDLLEAFAVKNGFQFEVVARGEHYDYLARLSMPYNTPS